MKKVWIGLMLIGNVSAFAAEYVPMGEIAKVEFTAKSCAVAKVTTDGKTHKGVGGTLDLVLRLKSGEKVSLPTIATYASYRRDYQDDCAWLDYEKSVVRDWFTNEMKTILENRGEVFATREDPSSCFKIRGFHIKRYPGDFAVDGKPSIGAVPALDKLKVACPTHAEIPLITESFFFDLATRMEIPRDFFKY